MTHKAGRAGRRGVEGARGAPPSSPHGPGRFGERPDGTLYYRPSCPFCSGPLIKSARPDAAHEILFGNPHITCPDCNGRPEDLEDGRRYSGPAWQTQQFQKEYRGRRIYAQVVEKTFETRGVAAVGGVRWVPPPALPGQPYRGQGDRRYGIIKVADTEPPVLVRGPKGIAGVAQRGPKGIAGVVQAPQGHGRRFGVPGHAAGTPGWAGAAGVAQKAHPGPGGCMRGARNKKGLRQGSGAAHAYGSLGYASMGDGSMDMATDGRRFGMTWRYDNICPFCGDPSEAVDARRFGGSPDLKPIFQCITIIDPFTGNSKKVCKGSGGGSGSGSKRISADLKDPFKSEVSSGRMKRNTRRKGRR